MRIVGGKYRDGFGQRGDPSVQGKYVDVRIAAFFEYMAGEMIEANSINESAFSLMTPGLAGCKWHVGIGSCIARQKFSCCGAPHFGVVNMYAHRAIPEVIGARVEEYGRECEHFLVGSLRESATVDYNANWRPKRFEPCDILHQVWQTAALFICGRFAEFHDTYLPAEGFCSAEDARKLRLIRGAVGCLKEQYGLHGTVVYQKDIRKSTKKRFRKSSFWWNALFSDLI